MSEELPNSEYERWERRFSVPDYVFGTEPNAFLSSQAHMLPKSGAALAVADGEGRNGVWLAEHGLDVLSIDWSPTGPENSSRQERISRVKWPTAARRRWLFGIRRSSISSVS